MKQTIRLTESKLRNFIAETVRETLNELDWRTYMSAANKAYDKGENVRGHNFAFAAEREMSKTQKKKGDNKKYSEVRQVPFVYKNNEKPNGADRENWSVKADTKGIKYKDGDTEYIEDTRCDSTSDFFDGDTGMVKRYNRLKNQTDNFNSGKTKYVNGKGWTDDVNDEEDAQAVPPKETNNEPVVQKQSDDYVTDKITQSVFQKLKNRLKGR